MSSKAKHAYGSRKNLSQAIENKAVDAFDVLFLSGDDETPAIGWIDKDGNPIIVESGSGDTSELEGQIAELETQVATKVGADEVDTKINEAVSDTVATAKEYTDGKVEAAISEHMTKKYEIVDVPEGTLVDYRDSEIRIMCPKNCVFTKQNVGTGGDANTYYVTFKTYVYDDNIVGYIEHLGDKADSEILRDLKTDEYGRRYQPTWLGVAKYDEATNTWTYYGANSNESKYIGWDYRIDWFDDNGVMVASDCTRINLSNENCHSSIEPYYVGSMMSEIDTKIDTKIAEVNSAYEVVEF